MTSLAASAVARKRAGGFSLGMGQRLGIAAALLGDPGVLILHQAVNGLDPEGVLWIRNLMKRLAADGRTVFVSSHLMNEMAVTADHLIVIGQGRLLADCPAAEFIDRNSKPRVLVKTPGRRSAHAAGHLRGRPGQARRNRRADRDPACQRRGSPNWPQGPGSSCTSRLATLAARSTVPVDLIVDVPQRPPPAIETIAYYCTAELLANVAKHSHARHAAVEAVQLPGRLRLRVTDDGTGDARLNDGGGLAGLASRVRTVDGRLEISSPHGGPTVVTIEMPSST